MRPVFIVWSQLQKLITYQVLPKYVFEVNDIREWGHFVPPVIQWQNKPQQCRVSYGFQFAPLPVGLTHPLRGSNKKNKVINSRYSDCRHPLFSLTSDTHAFLHLEVKSKFVSRKQCNSQRKYLSPPWPLVTHLTAKTKRGVLITLTSGMTGHPTQVTHEWDLHRENNSVHQHNLSFCRKL